MKELKKKSLLLPAVMGLGAAAYCLRRALYTTAVDEKGLLIANHPLTFALWAVVFSGGLLIAGAVWKGGGSDRYEDNFGPSQAGALGHFLMAGTVLVMALRSDFPLPGPIGQVWRVLGFLTAPAMVWGGICRKTGRKPFFGIHAALCLFLLLYLVSRYQLWSGNPQLQDYVFELLAAVTLTLFAYQHAAFAVDMGSQRMLTAMGLLTVLLCGGALYGAEMPGLYLCGAVWAAVDLPKKDEVKPHDPS